DLMANRKYSKAKKAQVVERQLNTKKDFFSVFRSNKKLLTIIGSVVIAAILIVVAFDLNVFKDNSTNPVFIPNPFPWGTNFVKVSNQNFGSDIHFYWVSWYGCPIGAANSWGLYSSLLNYIPAIKNDITLHTSDPFDSAPTEPGLIFNGNITNGKYYFNAYYMYNQYHNATGGGVHIPSTS
ncbi:membrane protein, partial [mine drainage metagenome]